MVRSNESLNQIKKIAIISTMITTATIGSYFLFDSYRIHSNKKQWRELSENVEKMRPELKNWKQKQSLSRMLRR